MSWLSDRLKDLPGKSKSGLARALGIAPSRITEILNGERQIQAHEWQPMARYLDWPLDRLHLAVEGFQLKPTPIKPLDVQKGISDLPVFACNVSPGGILQIDYMEVGRVERPPSLRYSTNAFALWVQTREQSPAFEPRDTILIDPNRPAGIGDDALLVRGFSIGDRTPFEGLIRRLIGETDKHWLARQFNPPQDQKLPKADWPRALYIAGKYSR
jgi:hypothetical protein